MWRRRQRQRQLRRQVWVGRGVYHLIFPLPMLPRLLAKAQARLLLDRGDPRRRHVQRGVGVLGPHRIQAPQE